ncbi:hypothetical protein MA04_02971 [Alcanivorax balearicus MACL04]|uniref:Uncharacterized protein n=1 Tax=Alloalcanivorax balearicus MACL04 TaxID=1177182 RepID=A0ABT2R1L1_9GAMM|nr:hypothetical protein [Alloalcanivorax balearicus]MCU5783671.1 hypothetical protein [Alloalcanivorax balearicus MACL04]
MSGSDIEALCRAFIADEDEALEQKRQGLFWPRNHHLLRPHAAKLPAALTLDQRTRFYFHYLRVAGGIPAVSNKELPLLHEAYRQVLPLQDQGHPINSSTRHINLLVFGFDDNGPLPMGATSSAKELKARLKLVTQLGKYTTLPNQREKKSKFLPFANEGERILQVLRHLRYRHDRRYGDDLYNTVNLRFWAMVLTALLSPEVRADLVGDMLDGNMAFPNRETHMDILHKTVQAVLEYCTPEEEDFRRLAGRLADLYRTRREATESATLARSLNLPFDPDEDWQVSIRLAQEGTDGLSWRPPNLALTLMPEPDLDWDIRIIDAKGRHFSERCKGILRNDMDMDGLGAGNLARFPDWLRALRERHGIAYDITQADVRAGRKRSAGRLIQGWLKGDG